MTKPIPTTLTRMLRIDYPVIGAPMWQVSYEDLAAAVSNAGGLGCIALPNYPSPDLLRTALTNLRQATDRPFGVKM